jgi:hypothetical protein
MISRRHAFIEREGDQLFVVDNDSRNGILVNGRPVAKRHPLRPGDVIRVGDHQFHLALAAVVSKEEYTGHQTIDYFARDASRDLFETMAHGIAHPKAPPGAIPWERLLRSLVTGPTEELFGLVLETIGGLVPFDRGFLIFLPEGSPDALKIAARRQGGGAASANASEVFVSREILKRVVATGEAVSVRAGEASFRPSESFVRSGAHSLLCVPLSTREGVLGVLYLDRLASAKPFSNEDASRLEPLLGLVSLKAENVRLLDTHVRAAIDRNELETAKAVQDRFLPRGRLALAGYSFDAFNETCKSVGGDCLDFVVTSEGKLVFVIGDVSGKGLPAALYMVGVLSTLRAYAAGGLPLPDVMRRIESYVAERFRPEDFLTLLLGELDPATGTIVYSNAGHTPPVVFRADGTRETLNEADPALNLSPWPEFRQFEFELSPGDLFLACTDGFYEERNEEGEIFGEDRLLACVSANRSADLPTIRERALAAVEAFGGGGFKDDLTMILLRRERT